jgi:transposase
VWFAYSPDRKGEHPQRHLAKFQSETAAAIHYALGLWDALARYLDDGRIEIDNRIAERALRPVAIGRRNSLFAGSDEGGSYCPSRNLLIN